MNPRFEMPNNYYFGGGPDNTFVTPLALVIIISTVVLLFTLPRKRVILPLLVAGLLIPAQISIVIAGFHFASSRVLLIAAWIRCLTRGEHRKWSFGTLDKAVLSWALANAITFILLWKQTESVTNRIGFLFTTLGTYFLMRIYIHDREDVLRVIRTLVSVFAVMAPLMLYEYLSGRNGFSLLGAAAISNVRDGRVRAQGPFLHAIIAGTVGALLLPLSMGLWWQGKSQRRMACVGLLASLMVMISSASSTPVMTFAGGIFGLSMFPARRNLRAFRWTFVLGLCGLQLVMKAPIWFLIARVSNVMGGSGFHRAELVDNFIHHFGEWWLVGTQNNADWGYYMWDVDNAYVAAGTGGGLITCALFIAVIVRGFKIVGKYRKLLEDSPSDLRLVWALGCALFANTVAYFGILYFDQSILLWYCLLAMIAAIPAFIVASPPAVAVPQVLERHLGDMAPANRTLAGATGSRTF
jgi:hypothetical protein